MARDTIVRRRQPKRLRLRLGGDSENREPRLIRAFSRVSRNRALRHLRNSTCYQTFAVLTFPTKVVEDRIVKQALDRFARRIIRLGISFFWKQEFYESGRPHLHLLLTRPVDSVMVGRIWAEALGVRSVHAYAEPIRTYEGSACYIMKTSDHLQNKIPEGYRNMGRYWGTRGPDARPDVLFSAQGDPRAIASLVRPVKAVERAYKRQRQRKPKRDNGISGMTFYDVGGQAVAKAVMALAKNKVEANEGTAKPRAVELETQRASSPSSPQLSAVPISKFLLLAGIWVVMRSGTDYDSSRRGKASAKSVA